MPVSYGKYVPIRLLGKGASGTVYLAQDTFSGAEVALKVLDEAVVTNKLPAVERRSAAPAVPSAEQLCGGR